MTKHSMVIITASLATLIAFAATPVARADIFEWEYINPANPGEGKQQSTMLAPDGAGVNAAPGANLSSRNLTKGYLIGANLGPDSGGCDEFGCQYFYPSYLVDTNFNQADLTNANLDSAVLTNANLSQADLTNANLSLATLTNANLSQANLTNAGFWYATLTGADLAGAEVRGASFHRAYLDYPYYEYLGGITVAQLYSTASYQAHDLTGISLSGNDLTGVNLAGQNLTNAYIRDGAMLSSANLSQANLSNAYISNATVDNADLSQANLTHANFAGSTLTGANLTGAEVRGTNLSYSGITTAQLNSTASYQAHDLTGIVLQSVNLTGVDLVGQNLTNARFEYATLTNANLSQLNLTNVSFIGATLTNADLSQANLTNAHFTSEGWLGAANLTGANLSQANLTNASFGGFEYCDEVNCHISPGANFNGANLSEADARGANFDYVDNFDAIVSNLIWTNGHIYGLDLMDGASLTVRNYHGAAAPEVVIEQHLAMDATGTLRLVFDADPWDSLISLAPGIPVSLGGTLELTFAPGVDIATQSGRTIDLFDWTGVTPTGAFTVSSPHSWDLSNLYTTGEVTLTTEPTPGDYNDDGLVNAADVDILWSIVRGADPGDLDPDVNDDGFVNEDDVDTMLASMLTAGAARQYGDADLDGGVGGLDYTAWRERAGTGWANGDFDGDGGVGGLDYTLWRTRPTAYPGIVGPHSGTAITTVVPEPASLTLIAVGALSLLTIRRLKQR